MAGLSLLLGCSRPAVDQLVTAARAGDTNRLIRLLAKGVSINSPEAWGPKQTALAAACNSEQQAAVELLLKNKANPNVRSGYFASTPLHEAVLVGEPNLPIIRALLDAGADPNIADKGGNKALDWVKPTDKRLIELLVSKGAVSRQRETNQSARAVTNGSPKSIPFKVRVANPP